MPAFNEANVEAGVKIVKDYAEGVGVGQDRSPKPGRPARIITGGKTVNINTDQIINALIHSPSCPVTADDVAEIKRRIDAWRASLPASPGAE